MSNGMTIDELYELQQPIRDWQQYVVDCAEAYRQAEERYWAAEPDNPRRDLFRIRAALTQAKLDAALVHFGRHIDVSQRTHRAAE